MVCVKAMMMEEDQKEEEEGAGLCPEKTVSCQPDDAITWTCPFCGIEGNVNVGEDSDENPHVCCSCLHRKDGSGWVCEECTFVNPLGTLTCICGATFEVEKEEEEEEGKKQPKKSRSSSQAVVDGYKKRKNKVRNSSYNKRPQHSQDGSSSKRRSTTSSDGDSSPTRERRSAPSSSPTGPDSPMNQFHKDNQEEEEEEEEDRQTALVELLEEQHTQLWKAQKSYIQHLVAGFDRVPGFNAIMTNVMRTADPN